jgi:hypothetical protein
MAAIERARPETPGASPPAAPEGSPPTPSRQGTGPGGGL